MFHVKHFRGGFRAPSHCSIHGLIGPATGDKVSGRMSRLKTSDPRKKGVNAMNLTFPEPGGAPPRSFLFVPAARHDLFEKAQRSAADAIILDFEDATPLADKPRAREIVAGARAAIEASRIPVWVRINSLGAGGEQDIAALKNFTKLRLVAPKIETAGEVRALCQRLEKWGAAAAIIAMIESPNAVFNALDIARASPRLAGLAFGSEDFAATLGVACAPESVSTPAQMIAMAASAAGLPAFGVAGSIGDFKNLDRFHEAAARGAALGFAGAFCIHPGQVDAVHRALAPSPEKLEWAKGVAALGLKGGGAVNFDGQMIDPPVVRQAERILARAGLK